MSNATGGKVVPKFRETFKLLNKDPLRWFPGHMGKGLQQMQQRLKNIDCVIEVHDARIPISGRYLDFKFTVSGLKPHIFVLNKTDLADMSYKRKAAQRLEQEGIRHIFFTNFKNQMCRESKKILPSAIQLIKDSNRYNRTEQEDFAMMVIGAPNVGKSSLINRLRNQHLKKANAAKVGPLAGVTRSVMNRIKISENPPVYLLDTPGILDPHVRDVYSGLKLSLVGCIQDTIVGPEIMADYLLFWLNKYEKYDYVKKLDLSEPTDNIMELLTISAIKLGLTLKMRDYTGTMQVKPNFAAAAEHFIRLFRTGKLGQFCLDSDIL